MGVVRRPPDRVRECFRPATEVFEHAAYGERLVYVTRSTLERWLEGARDHLRAHTGTSPLDEKLARDVVRVLGKTSW